ncbi:Interleukin-1 receptor type 1 [Oryzias melastigma]|uniref:Interleukin-1 receptor type 1 n=1 Tax=Oryzias melastigma TaxID=30732 RepID=A0A834CJ31_ORYME|nr:Interleukin-1 receptor type 1 [Oryzias melastigma]
MTAAGRLCLLAALLPLAVPLEHDHREETDTYHVSVGHLFLLSCSFADSGATWERGGSSNTSLPAGVEVRDGLLWFLPVEESHEGEYTCKRSNRPQSTKRKFRLSLSRGECPDPSEVLSLPMGSSGGLPCKQTEIFRLNTTRNVRWMKDCHQVQPEEDQIIVSEDGFMRFSPASLKDSGKYTCLIDISLNGKKYTAARSIQLTVKNEPPDFFQELHILKPQEAVILVQVGMSAELQCVAIVGLSEDPEILMFWTVNTTLTEDYEELSESWKFIINRGVVYGHSTLSISKVLPEFLNVPIQCHIGSPVEERTGRAWLVEADHSALYGYVAIFITASLVILLLPAVFFFKVDLVLGYRTLTAHFYKKVISDGKLYDAYVSFLQPKSPSVAEEAEFALQILPEELERQQGYSLYIRGRDDCPGEAIHDAITATLRQSRRLIIILSSEGTSHDLSCQCENQKQLLYEQTLGLHDALMMNDPKVILVEMDGPVDYRLLPESLQYIKRQQGALKWRKVFMRKNSLSSWLSNRHFWKNLRYHMPSVPARRHRTVV